MYPEGHDSMQLKFKYIYGYMHDKHEALDKDELQL